jgi:hypothetical protein
VDNDLKIILEESEKVSRSQPVTMKGKPGEIVCPSPTKAAELKILEPFSPSLFISSFTAPAVSSKTSIFKFPEDVNLNWDTYPSPGSSFEIPHSPAGFKRIIATDQLDRIELMNQVPSPHNNSFIFPSFSPTNNFKHYLSPKNIHYS